MHLLFIAQSVALNILVHPPCHRQSLYFAAVPPEWRKQECELELCIRRIYATSFFRCTCSGSSCHNRPSNVLNLFLGCACSGSSRHNRTTNARIARFVLHVLRYLTSCPYAKRVSCPYAMPIRQTLATGFCATRAQVFHVITVQ